MKNLKRKAKNIGLDYNEVSEIFSENTLNNLEKAEIRGGLETQRGDNYSKCEECMTSPQEFCEGLPN